MKQYHRFPASFLCSWEDTELVHACMHRILEDKISEHHAHASKQLEVRIVFYTNASVHAFTRSKVYWYTHLSDSMQCHFLMNMHVIYY